MKKVPKGATGPKLSSLVKKWEAVWKELNATNIQFVSFLDLHLRVNQKIKAEPLVNQWEKTTKAAEQFYDILEQTIKENEKVEPIVIKMPWEDEKFKSEWDNWKKYLIEQHSIVISSRTEQKQLDMLHKLSGGNIEAAYAMLDYSISNFYKMFFVIDTEQKKDNKKNKRVRKDDDFS